MVQDGSKVSEDRYVELRRDVELRRAATTASSGSGLPNFK